eukprot:7081296-Pyramimonas_sp.AAC.1
MVSRGRTPSVHHTAYTTLLTPDKLPGTECTAEFALHTVPFFIHAPRADHVSNMQGFSIKNNDEFMH